MKKIMLMASAAALLATASCKKNDDEASVPVTKENIAGSYKLVSISVKSGSQSVDVTSQFMDECEKDDVVTLKTDLTYLQTDAGVECSPGNEYDPGTWDLPNATTFIMDDETYTIQKFDGKTLEVNTSYDYNGQQALIITKFSKQ